MNISKLKIDKYKKFKGLELEFKPGINVIIGNNEAGKSTVVKAILDALFLNSMSKTKDVKETQSWFESTLGLITMDFVLGKNKKYSISKDFEKLSLEMNGEDTKSIRTQSEFSKFLNSQIGVGSKELYKNTAFITQREIAVIQDRGDLKDAIQNVSVESDSAVSIQDNISYLEKELKQIIRGSERWVANPGKIPSLTSQIEKLKKDYSMLEVQLKEKSSSQGKLKILERDLTELKKKQGDLELLIESNEKIAKAKESSNKINAQIDEIDKKLKRIDEIEELITKNMGLLSEYEADEIENDYKNYLKLSNQNIELEKENSKKNYLWLIFLASGIVSILFEIILNKNWFLIIGIIFVALAILFRFVFSKKFKPLKNIEQYFQKYKVKTTDDFEKLLSSQQSIKNQLMILESEEKGILGDSSLEDLKETRKTLYKDAESLKINYLNPEYLITEISPIELISSKREYDKINTKVTETESDITYLKGSFNNLSINEEDLNEMLIKIENTEEELKYFKKKKEIYELTIEALRFAFENTVKNFKESASKSISENLKLITNGRYSDIKIEDDFSIEIFSKEKNDWVDPISVLSTGTVDQIYFLIRLGFINFISPRESVPIILDDTFVSFDKERLMATQKLLQNLNKEQQILLFTHNDIYQGWGNTIRLD